MGNKKIMDSYMCKVLFAHQKNFTIKDLQFNSHYLSKNLFIIKEIITLALFIILWYKINLSFLRREERAGDASFSVGTDEDSKAEHYKKKEISVCCTLAKC